MSKLTDKQKKFIDEYLVDLNKKQAAIRAGYSPGCADRIAGEVFLKPHVQKYYQQRMEDLQRRTEVTQDRVINELARIAFAEATDYVQVVQEETGIPLFDTKSVSVTLTKLLTPAQKSAIAGIKQTKHGIEVNTYDKLRALELLGKYLGVFNDGAATANTAENNLFSRLGEIADKLNTSTEGDDSEL